MHLCLWVVLHLLRCKFYYNVMYDIYTRALVWLHKYEYVVLSRICCVSQKSAWIALKIWRIFLDAVLRGLTGFCTAATTTTWSPWTWTWLLNRTSPILEFDSAITFPSPPRWPWAALVTPSPNKRSFQPSIRLSGSSSPTTGASDSTALSDTLPRSEKWHISIPGTTLHCTRCVTDGTEQMNSSQNNSIKYFHRLTSLLWKTMWRSLSLRPADEQGLRKT